MPRAGEQGRGFAMVAGEVRSLAQRSAAATKEVKALIDDSVEKVDTGAKLVDRAGATMTDIVESVRRVADIINDIFVASSVPNAGIEQINQTITQMDQTTQQNAALVEEAFAAASAMQDQARQLAEVVNVFRLDGVHAAAAAYHAQRNMPVATPVPAPKAPSQSVRAVTLPKATANDGQEEF